MAKNKKTEIAKVETAPAKASSAPPESKFRETCEAIAIAVAVALVFRTFLAEMFVIPTGSMAPTLYGRHKDVVCPKCGIAYQVGASEEVRARAKGESIGVAYSTCANCGYTMNYGEELSHGASNPSYNGDRIIVGKYPYHLSRPKRWDVAVFSYPGSASMNYIKRVVGLPNETLRIRYGDIYTQPFVPEATEAPMEPFCIARKPADKILAMRQVVYDNDFPSKDLMIAGFPSRWTPITETGGPAPAGVTNGWSVSEDGKEFTFQPIEHNVMSGWLAYRHILPTWEDWRHLSSIRMTPKEQASKRPRLITDMTPYNTGEFARMEEIHQTQDSASSLEKKPDIEVYGLHWVSDLILECTVDVQTQVQGGKLHFGLVKAGKTFWCNIDLDSGQMELSIPGSPESVDGKSEVSPMPDCSGGYYICKGTTPMNQVDVYRFRFANVDRQLHVWVNDELIKFDYPTSYTGVDDSRPYAEDLLPVRIGCTGSGVKLSHMKLFRDIYYIAADTQPYGPLTDFPNYPQVPYHEEDYGFSAGQQDEFVFYTDPDRWSTFQKRRQVDFHLAAGQYFMMGDNSAASSDCRIWGCESFVSESLLVGEAFYVYWPHSWKGTLVIPNLPKFRMIH